MTQVRSIAVADRTAARLMRRVALIAFLLVSACTEQADQAVAPANKETEIDALARNLSRQADAWRDDTDNQEAAAEAQAVESRAADAALLLQNDAAPVANRR